MLDNDDVAYHAFMLDWEIQVDGDPGPGIVNHCVVAYSANKWNLVPVSKHTITNPVFGLVSNAFKVFSLLSHDCSI